MRLGSIYLFFDTELQDNRLSAQTFADMLEEDDEYLVPTLGKPTTAPEQRNSTAFTHAQRRREDKTVA